MKTMLLIMVAGIDSRFGDIKQIQSVPSMEVCIPEFTRYSGPASGGLHQTLGTGQAVLAAKDE